MSCSSDLSDRRVMVLGDDSRSTLAVIRSLGRAGITVDLRTSDAQTLCRYSKYVRRIISLPNVFLPTQEWVQALKNTCKNIDMTS